MTMTRAERKRIEEKKAKRNNQNEPPQQPPTSWKNPRKTRLRNPQKSSSEARDGGPQQNVRYSSSESSEPDEATQIFEWHGIPLPQFEIPQWRTRAGVPTIVLKPLNVDARLIPTNGSHDPSEDPGTDSQSDHSISGDSNDIALEQDDVETPAGNGRTNEEDNNRAPPAQDVEPADAAYGDESGKEEETARDDDSEAYDDNANVLSLAVEEPSEDGGIRDSEVGKIGYHLSKFIHSPFGPEGFLGEGWHGVKPVGKGGFGRAGMWERRGEDNNIVDVSPNISSYWWYVLNALQRLVIKQIGKHGSDKDRAWDPSHPLEVELMRALKGKANIVQIKGYRRYPIQEVHRIYMEYCSSGDLHVLMTEYRARR
ncbi:MAG: hypothetical protein Q9209_001191 [Squamulea sp. 1 TL-2023]